MILGERLERTLPPGRYFRQAEGTCGSLLDTCRILNVAGVWLPLASSTVRINEETLLIVCVFPLPPFHWLITL